MELGDRAHPSTLWRPHRPDVWQPPANQPCGAHRPTPWCPPIALSTPPAVCITPHPSLVASPRLPVQYYTGHPSPNPNTSLLTLLMRINELMNDCRSNRFRRRTAAKRMPEVIMERRTQSRRMRDDTWSSTTCEEQCAECHLRQVCHARKKRERPTSCSFA